jgi:hypothetical protein
VNSKSFKATWERVATLLIFLSMIWPTLVFADTEAAGYVVTVFSGEDSSEHRDESIKLIDSILTMILFDVGLSSVTECNGESVSTDELEVWLRGQKAAILDSISNDCDGTNVTCIPDPGTEQAEDYLMDIWTEELETLPALMVVDYEGRTTYFYSESSGIEPGESVWAASSPDCPNGCDTSISREQRPMYKASRVLTLHYLMTGLDQSSRFIVSDMINSEIAELDTEALDNKGKIVRETRDVICESQR